MLIFQPSKEAEKISTRMRRALIRAGIRLRVVHPCALGHAWKSVGGRPCPRRPLDDQGHMSQTVYQCARPGCEAYDYGEKGGPAYLECWYLGPCSSDCLPRAEILDDVDTVKSGVGIPTSSVAVLEHHRRERGAADDEHLEVAFRALVRWIQRDARERMEGR